MMFRATPTLRFPEDEARWKKWLDAIGQANEGVLAQLSLCSRHFSQACSADFILMDNADPTLELAPISSLAKPQRWNSPLLHSLPSSIRRPTITR